MIIVMFVAILALYFVLPLSARSSTAAPVLLVTLAASHSLPYWSGRYAGSSGPTYLGFALRRLSWWLPCC